MKCICVVKFVLAMFFFFSDDISESPLGECTLTILVETTMLIKQIKENLHVSSQPKKQSLPDCEDRLSI